MFILTAVDCSNVMSYSYIAVFRFKYKKSVQNLVVVIIGAKYLYQWTQCVVHV